MTAAKALARARELCRLHPLPAQEGKPSRQAVRAYLRDNQYEQMGKVAGYTRQERRCLARARSAGLWKQHGQELRGAITYVNYQRAA